MIFIFHCSRQLWHFLFFRCLYVSRTTSSPKKWLRNFPNPKPSATTDLILHLSFALLLQEIQNMRKMFTVVICFFHKFYGKFLELQEDTYTFFRVQLEKMLIHVPQFASPFVSTHKSKCRLSHNMSYRVIVF